jgi:hypothetical protein
MKFSPYSITKWILHFLVRILKRFLTANYANQTNNADLPTG